MEQKNRQAYTINQFCSAFGVSRSSVYLQIKLGKLTAHKIGNRTIILIEEAKSWQDNLPTLEATSGSIKSTV